MTLKQARKAINDYIKLAKKEQAMWNRRCKMHEKEMLRLCDVYMKLQEGDDKHNPNNC